ncbi:MAG: FdhF/YdeP family oxidoreductase [Verrucomicrobiota bacterium]
MEASKKENTPELTGNPNPENPEVFTGLRTSAPKSSAAGIPAVISSVRHVFSEMDVTRGVNALLRVNQKNGFDCPGCAWPDPDDERSSIAEYCENGAKAIAEEATTKSLKPEFFQDNSLEDLARLDDYQIGKKGRIAQPMYLSKGGTHYVPITWAEAFDLIARHLNGLNSPDEAVFYTSGRTSNEAAFLYQLFVREYGTNNLPDCSNMCHESSGVALTESLGLGKGSVTLEDFQHAEVILIFGQNPGTNHPRMLSALQKAKRNGSKIVSVNPLREAGLSGFKNPQEIKGLIGAAEDITDVYLQIRINGDMALIKGVMKVLLEFEEASPGAVFDNLFIQQKTEGFDAFIAGLRQVSYQEIERGCGISLSKIRELAELLADKKRIIICWAMGVTQQRNGVGTIQELVNLLLLKGSIGKPGAGTCPVRGHSNVQGDRTMGIYERPTTEFLNNIKRVFGFTPPSKHGLDVVDAIKAMHCGAAKVFIAMGGNFLSAAPDTLYTAEALRNCDLTVHVSTKLNRSHLVHGKEAIILPTLARSDLDVIGNETQFVTCENSMGVVQASKGSLVPISEQLRSEPWIVCEMAKATLGDRSRIHWSGYQTHYDHIRDAIELAIPGFESYNLNVRKPGGFYLPNKNRLGDFDTPSRKAQFTIHPLSYLKASDGEYVMMTIRSHDQFNTTIYGLDDRYRGIYQERRVVLMNSNDIAKEGLMQGDIVHVTNRSDGVTRVARQFIVVSYEIPQGCVAMYFPEANVLVPISSVAERSNTPVSKAVYVRLEKASETVGR